VFGGSQGSKVINDAIVKILPRIYSENIFIVHATGKDGKFYKAYSDTIAQVERSGMSKSALEQCYDPHPYLEDIVQYYKSVDLVISRAGAGTISEIAVMGKPSILIPLSGLAGDHQVINGMYLKNIAAAEIVFEESDIKTGSRKVSPDTLFNKIMELKENEHKRHYLVVNSAKAVENVGTEYIYLFIKSIAEGKSFDPKGEMKRRNSFQQESFDSLQDVRPVQEFDMPYTRLSSLGILKLITKEGEVKENSLLWIYLQYKIDLYLSSKRWQIRNNGVKIITQLKDGRHIEKLSYLFNNRKKAKLSHRILGGDFEEVGFVRRNIMTAYRKIGIYNDIVESDLKKGLRDPYYEVAAEALRTLSFFSEKIRTNSGIHELVRETLFRKEFEVVMEAIKTFGYLINSIEEYSLLKRFYYHKSWKIREAVVITLKRIYKAKVVDEKFVKGELDNILITSSGFIPMFSLKNVIKDL
jgi:UDP-N-acetylglucosamine--N-acetylmuramyl-(pentapeptide) pyrophosphoryl-undecaprenol N-acetylglucosamine transferase